LNIENKNYIGGSSFWLNSSEMDFHEIQKQSNVTPKWLLKDDDYSNKILKPVNKYSSLFSSRPEIIIDNKKIILRQKTHAEIWVQPMHKFLYALDKTMQRQFYPSDITFSKNNNCFLSSYKFYTPWVIDENITCQINSIDESPFVINLNKIDFKKNQGDKINCYWVYFYIKKNGTHMINNKYGIIEIGTPMFDIIVEDSFVIRSILEES
jgi:hypothetical protein